MNAQTTDRTISNFIRALRNADIRVSTAETLDALTAVELVGYEDRDYLKRALSLVLPKTEDEKVTFDACFDQFFAFQDVRGEAEAALSDGSEAEAANVFGLFLKYNALLLQRAATAPLTAASLLCALGGSLFALAGIRSTLLF